MKYISLNFLDSEVEQEYQIQSNRDIIKNYQQKQQWVVLPLILFQIITKILQREWVMLTALLVCSLLYLLNIQCVSSKNKYSRDLLLFIALVIYHFFFPYNSLFQETQLYKYQIDGYFQALPLLALINLLTYLKRQLILFIIFAIQITLYRNPDTAIWEQIILYGLQMLVYVQYCYCNEIFKRKHFMHIRRQRILDDNIYSYSDIESFVIKYNVRDNKFSLIQKDRQFEINERIQDDFIEKIRSIKVSSYDPKRRQTQFASQEQLEINGVMSLEMFLFYWFTNKTKQIKDLILQSQESYLLKGFLSQESYTIKLLKIYSSQPCALLLLIENKKDNVIDQLNLRNKISSKALDNIAELFKFYVKPSLISFQWIYKHNKSNKQIILINKLLKKINCNLLKCYNDFQNIQDYFNINKEFQRCVIQKFDIREFLEGIQQNVIKHYGDEKGLFFTLNCKLQDSIVRQDQRQLKQLFLNLFYLILEKQNTKANYVNVSLHQERDETLQQDYIRVRIEYSGHYLTKTALHSLPIINPQTISELKHNSQIALELQLPISLIIIRKIGPYDKMTLKQSKSSRNYMEFNIFNSLEQNYHLLPILSFNPKDNIQTPNSLVKRYSEYFDQIPALNSVQEF